MALSLSGGGEISTSANTNISLPTNGLLLNTNYKYAYLPNGLDPSLALSISYNSVSPANNAWLITASATVDGTFTLGSSSDFPEVDINAKVLHCICTAYNSGRTDHVCHLFGGGLHATGGQSWEATTKNIRKGSFQVNHEGDSSYPGSYYGASETGLITVDTINKAFGYRLCDGYTSGTHYIILTCFGYWM